MILIFILLFFWSEKSETTKIFASTASPTNKVDENNIFNENNKFDENDEDKFQSSKEFTSQNYETFNPMFSERYDSFAEEPTISEEEQYYNDPPPHQYFFTPTEEFVSTESYQRDEL